MLTKALTEAASEAETPKTLAGKREVKILKSAMEALINQKQYTSDKNEEIFQNPKPKNAGLATIPFAKHCGYTLLKKLMLDRRPYQTRHTYASMMLTAAEPIAC